MDSHYSSCDLEYPDADDYDVSLQIPGLGLGQQAQGINQHKRQHGKIQ